MLIKPRNRSPRGAVFPNGKRKTLRGNLLKYILLLRITARMRQYFRTFELQRYVVQVMSRAGSPVLVAFWKSTQNPKLSELEKVNAEPDII